MSHLPAALEFMAAWEGGLVDHPDDPGGATNGGISLRFIRQAYPDLDYDKDLDGDIDADDIRALTAQDRIDIYSEKFWVPYHYDELAVQGVAKRVFDMAVNMGPRQAARIVQRAVNAAVGEPYHLAVDGVVGPVSRAAINRCNHEALIPAMRADRWAVYRWIMEKKPQTKSFELGWYRRAMA